jgi:Asp-tRNA(Asn)/Glu-tRNA(Gln) amidotransferase A subunit family amidase
MDKIGPIARSVEDLGHVFAAIQGPDGIDPTLVQHPFQWPPNAIDWTQVVVGVVPRNRVDPGIAVLQEIGCQIKEVALPQGYPWGALTKIIDIEGAAVFDNLLREGQTEGWNSWTKTFQSAQYITAIDYLRMQRMRRKLMVEFEQLMGQVDLLFNAGDLMHTNFTGHPSVIMPQPSPDDKPSSKPASLVITGQLYGEETILALAREIEIRRKQPLPVPSL